MRAAGSPPLASFNVSPPNSYHKFGGASQTQPRWGATWMTWLASEKRQPENRLEARAEWGRTAARSFAAHAAARRATRARAGLIGTCRAATASHSKDGEQPFDLRAGAPVAIHRGTRRKYDFLKLGAACPAMIFKDWHSKSPEDHYKASLPGFSIPGDVRSSCSEPHVLRVYLE